MNCLMCSNYRVHIVACCVVMQGASHTSTRGATDTTWRTGQEGLRGDHREHRQPGSLEHWWPGGLGQVLGRWDLRSLQGWGVIHFWFSEVIGHAMGGHLVVLAIYFLVDGKERSSVCGSPLRNAGFSMCFQFVEKWWRRACKQNTAQYPQVGLSSALHCMAARSSGVWARASSGSLFALLGWCLAKGSLARLRADFSFREVLHRPLQFCRRRTGRADLGKCFFLAPSHTGRKTFFRTGEPKNPIVFSNRRTEKPNRVVTTLQITNRVVPT